MVVVADWSGERFGRADRRGGQEHSGLEVDRSAPLVISPSGWQTELLFPTAPYGIAATHMVVAFGTTTFEAAIDVTRASDRRLRSAWTVRIQPSKTAGDYPRGKTLVSFAESVNDPMGRVFPGWVGITGTNPCLAVNAKSFLLDQMTPDIARFAATFGVNGAGNRTVTGVLGAAFAQCLRPHSLNLPRPRSSISRNPPRVRRRHSELRLTRFQRECAVLRPSNHGRELRRTVLRPGHVAPLRRHCKTSNPRSHQHRYGLSRNHFRLLMTRENNERRKVLFVWRPR